VWEEETIEVGKERYWEAEEEEEGAVEGPAKGEGETEGGREASLEPVALLAPNVESEEDVEVFGDLVGTNGGGRPIWEGRPG
jgi:hypothetical protein